MTPEDRPQVSIGGQLSSATCCNRLEFNGTGSDNYCAYTDNSGNFQTGSVNQDTYTVKVNNVGDPPATITTNPPSLQVGANGLHYVTITASNVNVLNVNGDLTTLSGGAATKLNKITFTNTGTNGTNVAPTSETGTDAPTEGFYVIKLAGSTKFTVLVNGSWGANDTINGTQTNQFTTPANGQMVVNLGSQYTA